MAPVMVAPILQNQEALKSESCPYILSALTIPRGSYPVRFAVQSIGRTPVLKN